MLTHCPFCDRLLDNTMVKVIGSQRKVGQLHCSIHGHIDADIEALGTKHLALKKIFAKYHEQTEIFMGDKISDIERVFTPAEWEAIESLNNES